MEECDTIFIVGRPFPYIEFMPKPGQARGVQIDRDSQQIGIRFPVDVGLVGDSGQTFRALIPAAQAKLESQIPGEAQAGMRDWWKIMEERATSVTTMKPQVVAWELASICRAMPSPHATFSARSSGSRLMFLGNPEYGVQLHPIDFAESFAKGEPNRGKIALTALSERFAT